MIKGNIADLVFFFLMNHCWFQEMVTTNLVLRGITIHLRAFVFIRSLRLMKKQTKNEHKNKIALTEFFCRAERILSNSWTFFSICNLSGRVNSLILVNGKRRKMIKRRGFDLLYTCILYKWLFVEHFLCFAFIPRMFEIAIKKVIDHNPIHVIYQSKSDRFFSYLFFSFWIGVLIKNNYFVFTAICLMCHTRGSELCESKPINC